MKLLIGDPGHGGTDPGAVSQGYIEKELNMVVTRRVATILKEKGYAMDLTRQNDSTLPANQRTALVKDKYKYCLSIHFNAGGGMGIETIHSIYGEEGATLAELIAQNLEKSTNLPIRRVFEREGSRGDYYYMHRDTGSTITVIVECAFLDSAKDIKEINVESMAQAIAAGFIEFYQIKNPGKKEAEPVKHYKVSLTDVVEVDPLQLKISIQDKPGSQISLANFVTSGYQYQYPDGKLGPVGILVSEGKVIRADAPRGPKGTLIVYKDGSVDVKSIENINAEKNVLFAVSGCSILPKIIMKEEGFTGDFADIGRETDRPVIGWNPTKKKIIIAVRPSSNIARGQATLQNLGCTKGITLDGGGSTILKVGGKLIKSTARKLYSVITW